MKYEITELSQSQTETVAGGVTWRQAFPIVAKIVDAFGGGEKKT